MINAIFDSAHLSIIGTDAQGLIEDFNVGAERMLGYKAIEVVNQITLADIADPLDLAARAQALSLECGNTIAPGFEALVIKASGGIEDVYELAIIRKDGSRLPAVVSLTALRDAKNAITGFVLIGTDNTACKQAEEACLRSNDILRKAQLLSEATLDTSWSQICVIDSRGVLLTENQAWRDIRQAGVLVSPGLDVGSGIGSNYLDVCDRAAAAGEQDAATVGAGIRQVLYGALPVFNAEYNCVTPQGLKYYRIRVKRFVGDSGNAIVVHDEITLNKRAEIDLAKYQVHLQELVQTKTVDLNNANRLSLTLLERASLAERRIVDIAEQTMQRIGRDLHDDLGQHLTGIAFLSKTLCLKLQAAELPEQQDANQITGLLNEAVAKTRMLAQGLYPVALEEGGFRIMLEQLATSIEDNFRVECGVRQCIATAEDALAMGSRFSAPGTAINLYRIAQEAISNSIKHGCATKIYIAMFRQSGHAVFQISDNGCGMIGPRKGGLGMHTMRYRALLVDATMSVCKNDPHGVQININLSMPEDSAQQSGEPTL